MSLRIVYSQDFTIQPRYRKKIGITQDEHDRNVRRLKMFDRVPARPETQGSGEEPSHSSKTDTSSHNTQRADEGATNGPSTASGSVDRLPSYLESRDEPRPAPPAYTAGSSGNQGRAADSCS